MGTTVHRSGFKYYAIALIGLLLVGVVGYSYWQDFRRTQQINQELAALQSEVVSLQSRKVELQDLLQYFDSESYAESRARLELGLVRPGEKVLVVPKVSPTPGGEREQQADRPDGVTSVPFQAWWSFFFSRRNGSES